MAFARELTIATAEPEHACDMQAAMLLADMGATVVKIEPPHGQGDVNRPSGVPRDGQGDAGVLDICTAMVTPDGKRMAFYSMLSPPTADNPLGDMDILTVDRVY